MLKANPSWLAGAGKRLAGKHGRFWKQVPAGSKRSFLKQRNAHQEKAFSRTPARPQPNRVFSLAAVIPHQKATCRAAGCEQKVSMSPAPTPGPLSGYPRTCQALGF